MDYPRDITFLIKNAFPDEDGNDADGSSIYIATPDDDIGAMENPHEIVAPKNVKICCSYPLGDEYIFEFTDGPYTRADMARLVCATYKQIYDEEDASTTIPVGQVNPMMLNRNFTNGKYGIWGHSIDDLVLHTIQLRDDGIYYLGIDS